MNSSDLTKEGFSGFVSVKELMENKNLAPNLMGVYAIIRNSSSKPKFLVKGSGGFHKGEDPNVDVAELKNNWIENSDILYIGKAGSIGKKATLRSRLDQYMRFGQGCNVGHKGGRYIWQLEDHLDLTVCWKATQEEPRDVEARMIQSFKDEHQERRPFANLQD